jgi:hypothetical protein
MAGELVAGIMGAFAACTDSRPVPGRARCSDTPSTYNGALREVVSVRRLCIGARIRRRCTR